MPEYGKKTGRKFIFDNTMCALVDVEPDHDDWHEYTEFLGDDGEFTYVSDHEGYVLNAEEFGLVQVFAMSREEVEPCEAGTPGCSVRHSMSDEEGCQPW